MGGALEGIKVLDLSRMLPGPYCSMIMADHGARVIAIEDRRFIADDLYIFPVNRNKDHMTLNLKTREGNEIFFKLIKDADVLIEGFRPGVTKRLGIDYDTIKKANRKIIYCSITGYGQDGPYKDMAGHDVNYLSFAGVLDTIGEKDRPPCIPGIQIADLAGGAMNAAIGILLALFAREKTGEGQYVDISMTDGLVAMLSASLDLFQKKGEIPERSNHLLSHRYACYNVYETADGRYISIGALEKRFWKNLCTVLGVPEYIGLQYDGGHRKKMIEAFRDIFKKKTLKEWKEEFTGKDVCWGEVKKLDEIFDDPLFLARDMVCNIKDGKGESVKALGIPVKLTGTPGSIRTAPVGFGESTEKVLYELGYSKKDVEEFFEKGVV